MTTKTEPLHVRVFELMGWELIKGIPPSHIPDGWPGVSYDRWRTDKNDVLDELPLIHENFQLAIDWLVPYMQAEGYQFTITSDSFSWFLNEADKDKGPRIGVVPIRHFKIAQAACQAAIPILEKLREKKEKG